MSNLTKLVLWDMNAVLRSDYLLDYISDVMKLQSVQVVLNRNGAYHQLRRHISLQIKTQSLQLKQSLIMIF
ncbi:Tn3 family transposase [Legionella bozemanae]|uniref:Tn3 transposase DDE domain protein n=1 Tax=Legionella bozemanae TaxID=447 RepID=A0A0W0RQ43_LEGBO|nr:Tn3 family transposase [Legionella bozemanae]KTC73175.1 Tn3 transposase DDE domain protein [Legionella bozemanae]